MLFLFISFKVQTIVEMRWKKCMSGLFKGVQVTGWSRRCTMRSWNMNFVSPASTKETFRFAWNSLLALLACLIQIKGTQLEALLTASSWAEQIGIKALRSQPDNEKQCQFYLGVLTLGVCVCAGCVSENVRIKQCWNWKTALLSYSHSNQSINDSYIDSLQLVCGTLAILCSTLRQQFWLSILSTALNNVSLALTSEVSVPRNLSKWLTGDLAPPLPAGAANHSRLHIRRLLFGPCCLVWTFICLTGQLVGGLIKEIKKGKVK